MGAKSVNYFWRYMKDAGTFIFIYYGGELYVIRKALDTNNHSALHREFVVQRFLAHREGKDRRAID